MSDRVTSKPATRSSCWPDEFEVLLLRAGLCEMPQAVDAWKNFCERIDDFEDLPEGCFRLLPLVAGRLQDCTKTLPHLQRIHGVLRYAWAQNQCLLGNLTPHLLAMQEAGIDFLFLKGASLAEIYRERRSVRPMADLDILIHPEDVVRTVELLRQRGCTTPTTVSLETLADLIRFRHELTMTTATGGQVDIHWHLVSDARHPEVQEQFWSDAIPCRLGRISAKSLDRTDQMLHACLHGAVWNEVSPVRWLADCVMLMRAGIDWNRLERQARQLEHVQPVRDTILYLNTLEVGLPAAVAAHWQRVKITRLEMMEKGHRTRFPDSAARTRHLAWLYLRLHRNESLAAMLRSLPAYMKQLHHFRAYSRRAAFLGHLTALFLTQRTGETTRE